MGRTFSSTNLVNWYKELRVNELNKWVRKISNYKKLKESLYGFCIIKRKFTKYDYETIKINKKSKLLMGMCEYNYKVLLIDTSVHVNLAQLIDTIAHEIAHIQVEGHGKKHTYYKNIVKRCIKALILKEYLKKCDN
jgi:hypothetical protein